MPAQHSWGLLALLGLTVLAYASAFVGMREVTPQAQWTPFSLSLARCATAAITMLVIALALRKPWPERRDWPLLVFSGVLGVAAYNVLVNAGLREVTAGTTAFVVNGLIVLGSPVGAWLVWREHAGRRVWIALAVALCGLTLITLGRDGLSGGWHGVPLLVVGALCYIAFMLIEKRLLARYDAITCTTWAMACGALMLTPWSGDLWYAVGESSAGTLAIIVYTGVIPGALASLALTMVLSRLSVGATMLGIAAIPAATVFLAWLLLSELPATLSLIGGVVILSAVVWGSRPVAGSR